MNRAQHMAARLIMDIMLIEEVKGYHECWFTAMTENIHTLQKKELEIPGGGGSKAQ